MIFPADLDRVSITSRRRNSRRLMRVQELAGQIDVDHALPLCKGHLDQRSILLKARVVDEDVDRAEFVDRLRKHRDDIAFLAEVCADGKRAVPPFWVISFTTWVAPFIVLE